MHALVVANGTPLAADLLAAEICAADYVVAADGGANTLARLGLRCDGILGDFDSIDEGIFDGVPRIPAPNQDLTDLAKAVEHLIAMRASTIRLACVTGGRLDHTFGAVCVLAAYGRSVDLTLVDDIATARLVVGELRLTGVRGRTISLLPMTLCNGVATSGLRWDLRGDRLAAGVRESLSNVADADTVTVRVGDGDLVAYVHRG